jgi:FAD/FMN-containing dehydrogenase
MSSIASSISPVPDGVILCSGGPGWDGARAAWIVNADQQPAEIAVVRSVADVSAVVVDAARRGRAVMAQGTGHAASTMGDLTDVVLIRTSYLDQVVVDAPSRTVWVGAGAVWRDVVDAVAQHGLAVQAGSAADVGIAGYLLSGGISWLSRTYGLAVNDVSAIEIVGADGVPRVVDQEREPDLFWALRGGGGSFGVVTAFQLRLHDVSSVAAGTLFFPMERAGEVLHAWRRWLPSLSNATMSCARLIQLPPLPELPPPLSGRALVGIELVHQGPLDELVRLIEPLRALGPTMDTVGELPTAALLALHMDPPGPTPCRGDGMLLSDVTPAAIDALVAAAGHGSGSPLLAVDVRQLGGAMAVQPSGAGAVGHLEAEFAVYAVGVTPDAATEVKVDAHVRVVEHALAPWSAVLHYANFDEHSSGGRERFHDQATLRRLRAVKDRVDPQNLFSGGHPVIPRETQR